VCVCVCVCLCVDIRQEFKLIFFPTEDILNYFRG